MRAAGLRGPALAWLVACVVLLVVACGGSSTDEVVDDTEAPAFLTDRSGGPTTARALRGRPFNQSARNLDNAGLRTFADGAEPFDEYFTAASGLGPDHDGSGCLSCHLDGTVLPDEPTDGPPPGMLVRVSLPGTEADGRSPRPVPTYGLQLTPESAVPGTAPEALVALRWRTVEHRRADGRVVELREPVLDVDPRRGPLPDDLLTSVRMAPTMVGLGLLDAVPEGDLLAAAEAQAAGGVVSGRLNRVVHPATGQVVVGRFGWKAGQPTVATQTLAALHGDLGLSTPDSVGPGEVPELDEQELADLIFYNRTIAVPIGRDVESPAVRRGARRFEEVGCAACHTPTMTTGPDEISALSFITFHPYTDLLVHDLGEGLADGRPEFDASGSEWRTAPLWGLGRRVEVTGVRAFLHDGRARTPEEAIAWHGGEAARARRAFELLDDADARDLLAFLDAL